MVSGDWAFLGQAVTFLISCATHFSSTPSDPQTHNIDKAKAQGLALAPDAGIKTVLAEWRLHYIFPRMGNYGGHQKGDALGCLGGSVV